MEVNEVVFFIYMYYFQTYFNLAMKYIIEMFGGQLAIDEIEKYINRWEEQGFYIRTGEYGSFLTSKMPESYATLANYMSPKSQSL